MSLAKDKILLRSGLGEEMLASMKEEKAVEIVKRQLVQMRENNFDDEDMARALIKKINMLFGRK